MEFLVVLARCRSGEITESDLDLLQSRVLPEGKKPPADHLVLTAKKTMHIVLTNTESKSCRVRLEVTQQCPQGILQTLSTMKTSLHHAYSTSRLEPVSCVQSIIPNVDGLTEPLQQSLVLKTKKSYSKRNWQVCSRTLCLEEASLYATFWATCRRDCRRIHTISVCAGLGYYDPLGTGANIGKGFYSYMGAAERN